MKKKCLRDVCRWWVRLVWEAQTKYLHLVATFPCLDCNSRRDTCRRQQRDTKTIAQLACALEETPQSGLALDNIQLCCSVWNKPLILKTVLVALVHYPQTSHDAGTVYEDLFLCLLCTLDLLVFLSTLRKDLDFPASVTGRRKDSATLLVSQTVEFLSCIFLSLFDSSRSWKMTNCLTFVSIFVLSSVSPSEEFRVFCKTKLKYLLIYHFIRLGKVLDELKMGRNENGVGLKIQHLSGLYCEPPRNPCLSGTVEITDPDWYILLASDSVSPFKSSSALRDAEEAMASS